MMYFNFKTTKKLLLILTIAFTALHANAQKNCNIVEEYHRIFSIEKVKYGEREFLKRTVNKLEGNDCFSSLVNDNSQYIYYLQTHFSNSSLTKQLYKIADSVVLQNEFIKSLQTDSTFNNAMYQLTEKLTNGSQYTPDTVTIDDLLNVAVKYFSIIKINEKGNYAGKVCAGINGIKQTEIQRKPQIEAFCFTTILNNYKGEKFNMHNEFIKGMKELYKFNLGIDKDERLLRAQGAMYQYMRTNTNLKDLLLFEYQNKKQYLPFVLI